METGNITTAAFAAYLKCPTKGLLIARGEKPPQTFFGNLENNVLEVYKAKVGNEVLANFRDVVRERPIGRKRPRVSIARALFMLQNHERVSGKVFKSSKLTIMSRSYIRSGISSTSPIVLPFVSGL
jgi:hypothetical protein